MLLTRTLSSAAPVVRHNARVVQPVRCTAMVDPATPVAQPAPAAVDSPVKSQSQSGLRRGPAFRYNGPQRWQMRRPQQQQQWRPQQQMRPQRWQMRPQQQQQQWRQAGGSTERPAGEPQQQQQQRLPEINFIEDEGDQAVYKAGVMFTKFLNGPSPVGVAVRSLGRQGAAGALRFLVAVRELAEQAGGQLDVHFQVREQLYVRGFGTPLLFFLVPRKGGRRALPADAAAGLEAVVAVSARTDTTRLQVALYKKVKDLKTGAFVRMDMVGAESLHRGLSALAALRTGMGPRGSKLIAVPELAAETLRSPPDAQHLEQLEQQPEGQVVQVVRLYVGMAETFQEATGVTRRRIEASGGAGGANGGAAGVGAAAAAGEN